MEVLRMSVAITKQMQIPVGCPEEGTVVTVFAISEPFLNEDNVIVKIS
jgi:hypothetical protein